ncbi:MAG: 3-oxoacyl-ACP reductase FabG [Burkholderiales bacterium]
MPAGKIALVTGASRGIGEAIAKALAAQDAIVIGTATTAEGARKIAESGLIGVVLDVNDQARIEQVFAKIEKNHGVLAILVNNAGITRDNLLLRMKEAEWDDVLQTNLRAIYRTCKAALKPMMKARYGRIVNITSVIGVMGNAGQANYAAAKAGIIGFSKALAHEVGSRNITVNCVAPGFIATDMTKSLSEEQIKTLTSRVPLGRLGQTGDVAHAVAFLASSKAPYITGATLHVNGGMWMP